MDPLLEKIHKLFEGHLDVLEFLRLHNEYVHGVDDLVDKDKPVNPLDVAELAMKYYTHPIYIKHVDTLRVLSYLHHNTFRDSVYWEGSTENYKREGASALRHCSLDVFYFFVLAYVGPEALKEVSLSMREYTFQKHANDSK